MFLFVLNPQNSGSTAFARLLLTSPFAMSIGRNAEGQRHRAVRDRMFGEDRWNAEATMPWERIKRRWTEAWRAAHTATGATVVVEKSPPNLVRAAAIADAFPNRRFIVWNRNPYAVAASCRKRYGRAVEESAAHWLVCAAALLALRADVSPILSLTYEQACANPAAAAEDVLAFAPELGALDATAPLEIKDYPAAPLRDCNTEQIATLSRSEMDAITALLAPRRMLLEVFGYDLEAT